MDSIKKRALAHTLWVDKARLEWANRIREKGFAKKYGYTVDNNTTIKEICEATQYKLFNTVYVTAFGDCIKIFQELLSKYTKTEIEKFWPNHPTEKCDEDISKLISPHILNAAKVKVKANKSVDHEVHLMQIQGASYEMREYMCRCFPYGGPNPDLKDPIKDTIKLLSDNVELLEAVANAHALRPTAIYHPIEIAIAEYIGLFSEAATYAVSAELTIGDTNIFLLDDQTIADLIATENDDMICCDDMDHLPFGSFLIELESPTKIVESFETVAIGIYAHASKQSFTIVYYTDKHLGKIERPFKDTIINAPPYKAIFGIDIHRIANRTEEFFTVVDSIHTSQNSNLIESEHTRLLITTHNIWDFITCRNIDYEAQRRPAYKPDTKQYKHLQGKNAGLLRDYRLIKVNRRVAPYGQTEANASCLAFRIKIPGHFRKMVYCKSCGDLHRHDLIGTPCRRCTQKVGPFSNIDIIRTWVSPHWKGPENRPIQELTRQFK